jgi:beta-1,4-N-acetylglucosaminyltransferase
MILVTCGSSQIPFDRLIAAADTLDTGEELVVQHGPSNVRVAGARNVDFLDMADVTELVRDARVVISHAGVGSILLALTNGKRPCVVPRLARLEEAVDDHQLEGARRFATADLITLVEDPDDLRHAVLGARPEDMATASGDLPLVAELRTYISAAVAR